MLNPDLPPTFDGLDSIIIARFSVTRELLHGNQGFMRIAAQQADGAWDLFIEPGLEKIRKTRPDARGIVHEGLLKLSDPMGETHTLSGSVFVVDGETLIVAGYNTEECQSVSAQLLELHNQLENARRELAQLNRELKRREAIIRKLSMTDALTGIGNRRYFDDTLVVEAERANRYNQPLSLIMLDIDLFKQLTDTWGHATGDFVLREIGTLMQEFM